MNKATAFGILTTLMIYSGLSFAEHPRLRPQNNAITVCIAKSIGQGCFYRDEYSRPVSGTCRKWSERYKACTKEKDLKESCHGNCLYCNECPE